MRRCKHFANTAAMIRAALRYASDYERDFVRAYLDSSGVWGDRSKLDPGGLEAVELAEARIRDWTAYLNRSAP